MTELTLEEFLNKTAADEILVKLFEEPQTFSELLESVHTSRPTLSSRLSEGVEMDIWSEEIQYPDEGGKRKVYKINQEFRDSVTEYWVSKLRRTIEARRQVSQDHADVIKGLSQGDDPEEVDVTYSHDSDSE